MATDAKTRTSFMKRAIQLAADNVAAGRGGPFGCVIVKDGVIIAEGTNLVTSANDPTAHAEVVAIREACTRLGSFQLAGCEVYASCEPCPMCLGAIYWARPAHLYYAATHADASRAGFDDGMIREQLTVPLGERTIPTEKLMEEEGRAPFEAWLEKRDRVSY